MEAAIHTSRQVFEHKADVMAFLRTLADADLMAEDKGRWMLTGPCMLGKHESARPEYYPARYGDGWAVCERRFLRATSSGPSCRRVALHAEWRRGQPPVLRIEVV